MKSIEGEQDPPLILIGTHHKTGTKWMAAIFRALAKRMNRTFYNGYIEYLSGPADIILQSNSFFSPAYLTELSGTARGWRGIHVIRDPRDVVISACHYHQKSTEPWLHAPSDKFGGLTYQQAILRLDTPEEKLAFEMENRSADTILHMCAWRYDTPEFLELKYEHLVEDDGLKTFRAAFEHLGLNAAQVQTALRIAHNNSLFGAKGERRGQSAHVRSGAVRQWPAEFTPHLVSRFKALFPNAPARLGYEKDDDWGV